QSNHTGVLASVRGRLSRVWNAAVAVLTFVAAWTLSAAPAAIDRARQACRFVWRRRFVAGSSLAVGLGLGGGRCLCPRGVFSAAPALCGTAMSAVTFIVFPFTTLWAWLTRRAA